MSEVILEKARKRYEYHKLYHIEARDLLNEVILELNKQSISNIHCGSSTSVNGDK